MYKDSIDRFILPHAHEVERFIDQTLVTPTLIAKEVTKNKVEDDALNSKHSFICGFCELPLSDCDCFDIEP